MVNADRGVSIFAIRDVSNALPDGINLRVLVAKQNIACAKSADWGHLHFAIIIVAKVLRMVCHGA